MARRFPGFFLTLEGGDYSGKSSQIQHIRSCLEERGIPVVVTREPGGTPLGKKLRRLILHDPIAEQADPMAEMLLMAADRAEHVAKVIKPALAAGYVVVSDRFIDSSVAYQGYGLGLSIQHILKINSIAAGDLKPDLTILFDVPVDVQRERARNDGSSDRIESRSNDFFERVRQGYLQIARNEPHRFEVVDGTLSPGEVQRRVIRIVRDRVITPLFGGS